MAVFRRFCRIICGAVFALCVVFAQQKTFADTTNTCDDPYVEEGSACYTVLGENNYWDEAGAVGNYLSYNAVSNRYTKSAKDTQWCVDNIGANYVWDSTANNGDGNCICPSPYVEDGNVCHTACDTYYHWDATANNNAGACVGNTYAITFNANNGNLSGSSQLYAKYNDANIYTTSAATATGTLPTATRSGYKFAGWTTTAGGTSYVYKRSSALQRNVSGYTSNDALPKWITTQARTLYARWAPVYTITLSPNGGDGNTHTLYLSEGYLFSDSTADTILSQDFHEGNEGQGATTIEEEGYALPTRDDYDFAGYTSPTCGLVIDDEGYLNTENAQCVGQEIESSETWSAQWTAQGCASNQVDVDGTCYNGKFALKTTSTNSFSFRISANVGNFVVNCGDGGTLSGPGVSGTTVTRNNPDYLTMTTVYTCEWGTSAEHVITFDGAATGYRSNAQYSTTLWFDTTNVEKIASIYGSLGAIFGTVENPEYGGSSQPSFDGLFNNAVNMHGNIPSELFYGVHGTPRFGMFKNVFNGCSGLTGSIPSTLFCQNPDNPNANNCVYGEPTTEIFHGTFSSCSGLTGSIPANLFAGIRGTPAEGMFGFTFNGCSRLTGLIPTTLFSGISGTPAEDMFEYTFSNCSGLTGFTDGTNTTTYVPGNFLSSINTDTTVSSQATNMFSGSGLDWGCPEGTQNVTREQFSEAGKPWCSVTEFNVTYSGGTGATGSAPSAPTSCAYNGTCDAPANTYTKTDHTFTGWACSCAIDGGTCSCTSPTYSANDSIATATTTNGATITLTAQWEQDTVTITCQAGKYKMAGSETCNTDCPVEHYCPGGTYNYDASVDQGINECPAADSSTQRAITADDYNPTLLGFERQNWSTRITSLEGCMANYGYTNERGTFRRESIHYNPATGKYDGTGNKYYTIMNSGYYAETKIYASYCSSNPSSNMLYQEALPCPTGSYCPGVPGRYDWPSCSSGTYEDTYGIYSCSTATSGAFPNSDAMAGSVNQCYTTCPATIANCPANATCSYTTADSNNKDYYVAGKTTTCATTFSCNGVYTESNGACVCNHPYAEQNGVCQMKNNSWCDTNVGTNYTWNGTDCVCASPYVLDGAVCHTACTGNLTWNASAGACTCQSPYVENNGICHAACTGNLTWSNISNSCACQSPYVEDNGVCHAACESTQYWSSTASACVSKNDNWCDTNVGNNYTWNGTNCACQSPYVEDNGVCHNECESGYTWDSASENCICDGYDSGSGCYYSEEEYCSSYGGTWCGATCYDSVATSCTGANETWDDSSCSCISSCDGYEGPDGQCYMSEEEYCTSTAAGTWCGGQCYNDTACEGNETWDDSSCSCVSYCNGYVGQDGQCYYSEEEYCSSQGGNWSGAQCYYSEEEYCSSQGGYWCGGQCYNDTACEGNETWDDSSCSCSCTGYEAPDGQCYMAEQGYCESQGGTWCGDTCYDSATTTCDGNRIWDGGSCSCSCIGYEAPDGTCYYATEEEYCEGQGYTWDSDASTCFYGTGEEYCQSMNGDVHWDGTQCIDCFGGRWDSVNLQCVVCGGNLMWDNENNECACMSPFVLGDDGICRASCTTGSHWSELGVTENQNNTFVPLDYMDNGNGFAYIRANGESGSGGDNGAGLVSQLTGSNTWATTFDDGTIYGNASCQSVVSNDVNGAIYMVENLNKVNTGEMSFATFKSNLSTLIGAEKANYVESLFTQVQASTMTQDTAKIYMGTVIGNDPSVEYYNNSTGQYCFCQLDGYKLNNADKQSVSGTWLYFYTTTKTADYCASNCASICAYQANNNKVLRAIMFGAFTPEYPTCTPDTYTVTYECGEDATGSVNDGTATYGQTFTPDTGSGCSREGFRIVGWSVSDTEDTVFSPFTWEYASEKTLTATWAPACSEEDIFVPADKPNMCFPHVLHVGDNMVYLKAEKLTTPSLNIMVGDRIFYANMTTEPTYMSSQYQHYLKMMYNGMLYYVCDDTTYMNSGTTDVPDTPEEPDEPDVPDTPDVPGDKQSCSDAGGTWINENCVFD